MDLPSQSAARRLPKPSPGLLTAPFAVAVALLGVAVVLAGPVASWLHINEAKRPLPLRSPLTALSESDVTPYRVVKRHLLEPAMVEALGTDRYLSWTLEDHGVPVGDPLRFANLLVTYYSGGQNLVPHTPDVCYLGAGYAPAQPHENRDIDVPSLGGVPTTVPIRVCTFGRTAVFGHERQSVVYTFHCNGRFVATRTGIRLLISDLTQTYAYFSKVEASFPKATRQQSIEGATKLFDRVLPVLVRDHWPNFTEEEKKARQQAARGSTPTTRDRVGVNNGMYATAG